MSATMLITYFAINFFGIATERSETVSYANLDQCKNSLDIRYYKYNDSPNVIVDYKKKRDYLRIADKKNRTATTFKCKKDN